MKISAVNCYFILLFIYLHYLIICFYLMTLLVAQQLIYVVSIFLCKIFKWS